MEITKDEILKMDLKDAYEAYLIIKDELDGEEILEYIWLNEKEKERLYELLDKEETNRLNIEEKKELKILEKRRETTTSLYQKIRFGIDIHFDIYTLFSENYTQKQKKEKIVISKNVVSEKAFFTEIENRRLLIKEILCYYYLDDSSLIRAGDT